MIKIAPSTNPEREEDLINYVKTLEQTDADFLHCDVMDGNFVENKCLSAKKIVWSKWEFHNCTWCSPNGFKPNSGLERIL